MLIVFSLGSAFIGIRYPIWILNESQILYLYSTSAQVLAGIYGLTLTGFIFFRNELSREESSDESIKEVIESLKKRYFKLLLFITVLSIFTLLLCNFIILIESGEKTIFKTIAMNVAQSSFVVSLIMIAYFIFDVITPDRIEKASLTLQQILDPSDKKFIRGDFEEFLKNFNEIERILQQYGQDFQLESYSSQVKYQRRISNVRLAQILLKNEKINNNLFNEIKELITLRNSIVHGAIPTVSSKIVTTSKDVLEDLVSSLKTSR